MASGGGGIVIAQVYESATKIGQEFQRVIEQHGQDVVDDLLPLVVEALEHLEQVVEEVEELHKVNGRLSVEASQLQAETEARQKLSRDSKSLKDLVAARDRELKNGEDKVRQLQSALDRQTTKLKDVNKMLEGRESEISELQDQIKDKEKFMAEKDGLLKEKTVKLKQLSHQVKDSKKDTEAPSQLKEELSRAEAHLETAEAKLEEKTKMAAEKERRIKQLRKQLEEQKAKMNQQEMHLATGQDKLAQTEKEHQDVSKKIADVSRQNRKLDDKLKKMSSDNQTLRARVTEMEEHFEMKDKLLEEKNVKIQQLSKELDEHSSALAHHKNGVDRREVWPECMKSTSQNGSKHSSNTIEVESLKERISELEEEVIRLKSSTFTLGNKSSQVRKPTGDLKQSVPDTKILTGDNVPEFYRSDVLHILAEKTEYMSLYYNVEEERDQLQKQLIRLSHPKSDQRKVQKTQTNGVRNIMDQTVTLRRDLQLQTQ